jgi:hypothetical protein
VLALAASSANIAAQGRPLRVTPNKNLTFGMLFPGVPFTVAPNDALRAGAVDITGPNGNQIEVTFTLPTALSGPAASSLPVSFGSTSAGFTEGSITTQVFFDPRVAYRPRLSRTGRGTVYVGGIAQPTASQRSGNYSATIIVTVALTGL